MRLLEQIKDYGGVAVVAVGVIALALFMVFGMSREMRHAWQVEIAQKRLDESVSKNEPGRFGVENFAACKKAGSAFSSPPSDAHCIMETVNGAEKLKGREFGAQVVNLLADWLEQSNRLRP